MNIRKLFDLNRFKGCLNPRSELPYFDRAELAPLSVRCVLHEGKPVLQLFQNEQLLNHHDISLLPHTLERIAFWEKWTEEALLHEYEDIFSLHGIEAYGVSVAMEIASTSPKLRVDYNGLPVHDEETLYQYIRAHTDFQILQAPPTLDDKTRPLDNQEIMNVYLKKLIHGENTKLFKKEKDVRYLVWDVDWSYIDLYLSPHGGAHKWGGYIDSFFIEEPEFPSWIVDRLEQLGKHKFDDFFWSNNSWHSDNPTWKPSPILHPLWNDALAIDISRYINPPCRISFRPEYTTGEDLLSFRTKEIFS